MKRTFFLLCLAGVVALAVTAWSLTRPRPRQAQQLPDGSVLSLESVKLGQTSRFVHGTLLEQVLGPVIPAKGVRVLRWRLRPPQHVSFGSAVATSLAMEFKLTGLPPRETPLVPIGFDRDFRAIIVGEDGFEYVNELNAFQPLGDAYYGYLVTSLFPRDSRLLRIRLERRESQGAPWRTLAQFVQQQRPASDQNWKAEPEPRVQRAGEIQVELGEVAVRSGRYVRGDIWEQTVLLPWRITQRGSVLTNWSVTDLFIRDSSGNGDYFGAQKLMTNGWVLDRLWRSPDPRKTWKIHAALTQDSAYAASDLVRIRVAFPLNVNLETNVSGFPLRLGYVKPNMVTAELLATNRADLRLSYVRAEDETGSDIGGWAVSESQFGFRKQIQPPVGMKALVIACAIHKNIPIEFTVQPGEKSERRVMP